MKYSDQELLECPKYPRKGWIGVDFDGTLVITDSSTKPSSIGKAVPQMLNRVRYWVKTGRTVKIFTARAGNIQDKNLIHQWCVRHGLPKLEITNRKDHGMIALWDDRAIGVVRNVGVPVLPVKMTLWQSLRLRLSMLIGGNAIMAADCRHLQAQFQAAHKASLSLLECEPLEPAINFLPDK